MPSDHCANLHPPLHLGEGCSSPQPLDLHLSSGRITTTLPAVYQFPCKDTFDGLTSGLGTCPARITVTAPLATPLLRFTPWAPVLANNSANWFSHMVLDIPPPVSLNQSVLWDLDQTFNTTDGQLTHTLDSVEENIDNIEEQPDTSTAFMGYAALVLSISSCIMSIAPTYLFYKTVHNGHRTTNAPKASGSPASTNTCPGCHRPRSANYVAHPVQELEGEDSKPASFLITISFYLATFFKINGIQFGIVKHARQYILNENYVSCVP